METHSDRTPEGAASGRPLRGPRDDQAWWRTRAGVRDVLFGEDALRKVTAPATLIVICIVFGSLTPRFFSADNISGMLADSAIPILLALGATFVLSLGGIDLSLSANVSLASVVAAWMWQQGFSLLWACLAAVTVSLIVGLVNGLFIGWLRIPDFIVTLGTMSGVMGLALVISRGETFTVGTGSPFFVALGTQSVGVFKYQFLAAIFVAVVAYFVLFRLRVGTHVLAVGDNAEAAVAMGIDQRKAKLFGYGVSGLLAGMASILLMAYIGSSQPSTNSEYMLNAIAAVVLGGVSLFGGRAAIFGPVCGAILMTVLRDSLVLIGFSAYYTPIAIAIVILASATLMRSR